MSQISKKLRSFEGDGLHYWCQGCDSIHGIQVGEGPGPRWGWNGDLTRPTFTPSVLVRASKITEKGRAQLDEWKAAGMPKRDEPFDYAPTVCHTFITDGKVQFLSDCTHALAGQTLDLPDLPDWLQD